MYLREDHTPYYIGKGKKRRAYHHSKSERIKSPKDKSRIRFIKENISENDAYLWEVFWIAEFGRIDLGTGCLRNKTDGGDSPPNMSGIPKSEETKQRMRKPKSEQHKKNIAKSAPARIESRIRNGKNISGMKDKHHTEETKKKLREIKTGTTMSEESSKKKSDSLKGKPWSEARKLAALTQRKSGPKPKNT